MTLLAVGICLACLLMLPRISSAQGNTSPNLNVHDNEMQTRMELSNMDALGDKDQVAAFKTFTKEADQAKKIQLGSKFLQKYPKSPLAERVDVGMMGAYHNQQDWKDMFSSADNALALKPDDVEVLTEVAWTIPHVYNPNDADADQQLTKAETYAKHALDVMPRITKPVDVSNAQFAEVKTKRTFQAHSALGLVYFRRDDYENSAKELTQATDGNPMPDATDLYVLGIDLQNDKHYSEAADAFTKCGAIASSLQDQCKQNADSAKKLAEVTKK
jgi:tetratricopeptide (TPR) repeat protein